MRLSELRRQYHERIGNEIIYIDAAGVPNFADKDNKASSIIAKRLLERLDFTTTLSESISGQTAGRRFETINREFLSAVFEALSASSGK